MYNVHTSDGSYGVESIMDIHKCDTSLFTKENLLEYVKEVTQRSGMTVYGEPFVWDAMKYEEDHLNGISVLQWIMTSSIVIHSMNKTGVIFINIFSCKEFDVDMIANFSKEFFQGQTMDLRTIKRGVVK